MWLFFAEGGEGVEMSDKEKIGSPTSSALGEETANPRPPKKHPPARWRERERVGGGNTLHFPAADKRLSRTRSN